VINLGTRHPNAAPTLWQPVGNHFPTNPIILAFVPVRLEGNSIKFNPPNCPPLSFASFFHVILKRFRGCKSHKPISANSFFIDSGISSGFLCWAKVGIIMFRSRTRLTVRAKRSFSICKSILVILYSLNPLIYFLLLYKHIE